MEKIISGKLTFFDRVTFQFFVQFWSGISKTLKVNKIGLGCDNDLKPTSTDPEFYGEFAGIFVDPKMLTRHRRIDDS